MNTQLPPIFILLKPQPQASRVRAANIPVLASLLMLGALSLALIAASGVGYFELFGALCCLVLASFAAWKNAHLAQAISQLSHSGNQQIVSLHWRSAQANTPPTAAHWLSFHRLGALAWIKLSLLPHKPQAKPRKAVIFMWQGTNPAIALQQQEPLREWARRWHTLSRMSDAPDFLPNN